MFGFNTSSRPKVYISLLSFNNKQAVFTKKNDIIVFVGPNNAGKSQALRDIWNAVDHGVIGTVIKTAFVRKDSHKRIKEYLRNISDIKGEGSNAFYYGFNYSFPEMAINNIFLNHLGDCRNAFICHLGTEDRLLVCKPPETIELNGVPQHPIHQIVKQPYYRETLTRYFKKAFGIPLVPNSQHGKTIPLCLGDIPPKTAVQGDDAQEMAEWYAQRLEEYPVLHEQGDGMRSFAGVLLYLSIGFYHTFLIDEPESFLHPPQATIMGHVIAELLKSDQQAFISTHSQYVIKGLLDKAPDRVKIIRITRSGNQNSFSILNNNRIQELLKDPLLKYSGVLDGMFYKNVVICESDSDCRFYSIINDYLKQQEETFSETLFIHSGGKGRMENLVQALKALSIDFRVVSDIDFLNQERDLKSLIETCGGAWKDFKTDYNTLLNGLENVKNITGHQLLKSIEDKISGILDAELSRTKMDDLRRLLDYKSRWDCIKQNGINGAPAGDATRSLNNIVDHLKEIGIYLVPVGELECFVKEEGEHGPKWLNSVLEHHPDLNDEVFKAAKEFVASWNI